MGRKTYRYSLASVPHTDPFGSELCSTGTPGGDIRLRSSLIFEIALVGVWVECDIRFALSLPWFNNPGDPGRPKDGVVGDRRAPVGTRCRVAIYNIDTATNDDNSVRQPISFSSSLTDLLQWRLLANNDRASRSPISSLLVVDHPHISSE